MVQIVWYSLIMEWQVVEAKSKLSALLVSAHTEGPQVITKRGHPDAVVLAYDDYERLRAGQSLTTWLSTTPQAPDDEEDDPFERGDGTARDVLL